jgi:hypothetical protein
MTTEENKWMFTNIWRVDLNKMLHEK